jgi:hypothetical protein
MICMAAHRYAWGIISKREYPILRNDNTARGKGAHQHLASLTRTRRYRGRLKGKIPQLEYVTLDQALKALI